MIRVLIERRLAEGMAEGFRLAIRNTRIQATPQAGYISGESLRDRADPNHFYVVSTWNSVKAWRDWEASEVRRAMMAAIGPMLAEPEKITILEPV